jgi:cytochrome P450
MSAVKFPPGPKGTWLGGHLGLYKSGRLNFFTRCAREYGDVVSLRFGYRRIFLVSHPDIIESIVLTNSRNFIKHFALRLNPLVLGKGLLTSESDFWLRQRRLIQPAFGRQRIAAYGGDMVAAARRVLDSWKPGEQRDILTEMMRLTLDIAARTLFGADVSSEAGAISQALQVLQDTFLVRFNSIMPLPTYIPTPRNLRLRRAVRQLDAIVYDMIRKRRQSNEERGDLLSILLHARDEDDGSRMTDRQLRDEAMTLFLAGHETTALALSWTWALLAQNPMAEEALLAEVQTVLNGRLPTVEDWPKLRFTEYVVTEAMRLYPPAYVIGREALADCDIGGYPARRGTTALMSQWVVHRDPRFFDKPDEFRPERWADGLAQRLPKYAYFPFGGGPRLCIGNTFAMMETTLVLATIAQRYRFTLAPGHQVAVQPTFTLRPLHGIQAILTPR